MSEEPSGPADEAGGAGGSGATSSGGAAGGAGGGGTGGLSWGPCPEGFRDECATIDSPLDPDRPGGETIEIFFSRSLSGNPDAPQLWMLQGGPGGSAEAFAGFFDSIRELDPNIDLYTLEHRGVGDSTRLGCPDAESPGSPGGAQILESEIDDCIAELDGRWGQGLQHFSTTNAARDLGHVIELTRGPDQRVFVYGVSYGTVWAHRYLQIFPDQADAVVLDSIASPGASLHTFGEQWDPIAKEVMDLCAADPLCSSKLGPDPFGFIAGVFDKIDAGHCPELGADRDVMRQVAGALLASVIGRTYIAPVFYRIDRCDGSDLSALATFFNAYFWSGDMDTGRDSSALLLNIGLSELWADPPPPLEGLQASFEASLFGSSFAAYSGFAQLQWPTYPHDEYVWQFASTTTPVLMMNGTLDPQTPMWMAEPLGQALTGPHQTFVTVPLSPHGVISQSLVDPIDEPACGLTIMMSFLAEPTAPPDTSCIDDIAPIPFGGFPAFADVHWGGQDPYESFVPFDAEPGASEAARPTVVLPQVPRLPRGL